MVSFKEANQARLALKMKLINHSWYKNSGIITDGDDYIVVIIVTKLDNQVRKIIPPLVDGVQIKTEVE